MSKAPAPDFRAYTVIKGGEGKDDYWLPIGAAFAHADKGGYNVVLQALPIDGRVVLRIPKDDDAPAEAAPRRENIKDDRRKYEKRR